MCGEAKHIKSSGKQLMGVGGGPFQHDVNSLLRYAMTGVGSCLPQDICPEVDTKIINTAASKILGVHRTARVKAPLI